jgi:putative IMPACT (imprinted ancient) family translation regulator
MIAGTLRTPGVAASGLRSRNRAATAASRPAYGAAADAALAAAERRTINLGSEGAVTFAYPHQKTLAHLLTRHGGRLIAEQYAQDIIWRIWLPQSAWNNFMRAVAAATAGQAHIKAPAPRDRS